ncbi:MAG: insulinase family protein [Candidatus Marinimicrobia bacterium]|nr:insulinase family protein [Candidatus Neomarinimicrobiota bacterium]
MKKLLFFTITTLLLFTSCAVKMDLDSKIPIDEKVKIGKFNNGLTYYIRQNHKPENRATLRLVVNSGSILEDDDQQGLAHLCEHMAFNGTKNFPKADLVNYLESIGMRFGADLNAYTSFDETVYKLSLPTDSIDQFKKGFQILEDWGHLVSYDNEEIDKERLVVLEELRSGRGASARMRDKEFPTIFQNSKYAVRLPIGKKEIVKNADYGTLKSFYKDWYRPDLMAVIAVGDFDVDSVEKHIITHFQNIKNPKDEKERKYSPVPKIDSTLYSLVSDPEATTTSLSIYYKKPVKKTKTVNDYRDNIIESLYNSMLNERLTEMTLKENPPFLRAVSGSGNFVRTSDVYYLGAQVKDNGIYKGFESLLTEAKRVNDHGFLPSELKRAKKNILSRMEKYFKEKDKTNSVNYVSEYQRHFLSQEPIPGIEYEYQLYEKYLPTIKISEVNSLGKSLITDTNRVIVTESPEKETTVYPTKTKLQDITNKVNNKSIEPYQEEISDEPLIKKLPDAGKIVEENYYKDLNVTELVLSNGVKVVLKPTDFKNDQILMTSFSPGGWSLASDENLLSAKFAGSITSKGGLGEYDITALQKKLAGKIVSVNPYISNLTEGLNGSCAPKYSDTFFELTHAYFTIPRKDSTAYNSLIEKIRTFLVNKSASPKMVYSDSISVTLTQHHPRRKPLTTEQLSQIKLNNSFEFYKDRFVDASDFTFIFVGNFEVNKIKKNILKYIGSLPSTNRDELWCDEKVNAPKGIVNKNIHKGIEKKSVTQIVFPTDLEWNLNNLYSIQAMKNVLNIKLREILREDLGGTYGARVNVSLSQFPDEDCKITISLGCDPDRVDELTKAIFVQIDSLRNFKNFTEEIEKVKEKDRRGFQKSLKQNKYWLNKLNYYYYNGFDLDEFMNLNTPIDNFDEDKLLKAANKHLDPGNYIQVTLYPGMGF